MSLGSNIARALATSPFLPKAHVQLCSRHPERLFALLESTAPKEQLLSAMPVDITKPPTLTTAFKDANVVVSLVGIMHGSQREFEEVQVKGAENVARAAKDAGAKLIHFSAIGANRESPIPYWRTKGLAEDSVHRIDPTATIIRPSIVFGPEDDFFNVC
jgi:uncharacterized protein YbjT (DUF2867 family)